MWDFPEVDLQVQLTEIEPGIDIGIRTASGRKNNVEPVRNRAVSAGEGLCNGITYQFSVRLSERLVMSKGTPFKPRGLSFIKSKDVRGFE
jgi:hypothetical protein